jgi:LmbE family N-acetylglucosaminyl deacetylase
MTPVTGGLLAIFAHPDDETFGVGGTMAHYADRGVPVTMICATRGEVGEIAAGSDATPENLGAYREQELRDAMAILGVTDVRFLNFRDSGMHGTPENGHPGNLVNAMPAAVVDPLVQAIRERQPDAIVTWDASGGYGHPDHIAVHEHATAAYHAAADSSLHTGMPWRAQRLFYVAIPMAEFERLGQEMRDLGMQAFDFGDDERIAALPRVQPNCVIDVSSQYDRKRRAMLAHSTQITEEDPFLRLPDAIQRRFFGREYFYCADPALADGVLLDDLLAAGL